MTDTVGKIEQLFGNSEQFNDEIRTTIELRNKYGTYTISVNEDDLDINQMYDELIKPLLLAAGFHIDTIEEVFEDIEY